VVFLWAKLGFGFVVFNQRKSYLKTLQIPQHLINGKMVHLKKTQGKKEGEIKINEGNDGVGQNKNIDSQYSRPEHSHSDYISYQYPFSENRSINDPNRIPSPNQESIPFVQSPHFPNALLDSSLALPQALNNWQGYTDNHLQMFNSEKNLSYNVRRSKSFYKIQAHMHKSSNEILQNEMGIVNPHASRVSRFAMEGTIGINEEPRYIDNYEDFEDKYLERAHFNEF